MKFIDGRSCPTDYRYSPESIGRQIPKNADVLYVIGGLYGNIAALDALDKLVAEEQSPVTLCFNGDFNWFNRHSEKFEAVNQRVLKHDALRGNIETELASQSARDNCGCGYPDFVDDEVVERSNQIIGALKKVAVGYPDLCDRLGALPMTARYRVGGQSVAVLHGDPESLAGWSLSRESIESQSIEQRSSGSQLGRWFRATKSDIIASTHTCLPYLCQFDHQQVVINNGSAGMPNFDQSHYGVITRIGDSPLPGTVDRLYGTQLGNVNIDALALRYEQSRWVEEFIDQWHAGTAADVSYRSRIEGRVLYEGRAYTMAQALLIPKATHLDLETAADAERIR